MDGASGDVARYEITVLRIPLLEEVPAVGRWNRLDGTLIALLTRDPDTPAFAARRFRHQAKLVFAGDRRGVDLDEFAVGVERTLLIDRRLRRSRADHGVR